MVDQLTFDTTSADTIADSDNVGAYLRSDDGTLLTHTTDGAREALDVYTELNQAESSSHTSGDTGVMALGVRNDAHTALAADGEYIPLTFNATGDAFVTDTAAQAILTTIDGDTSLLAAGTHLEDDPHASGDRGYAVWGVRNDSATALAADGDYIPFTMNDDGAVYVTFASDDDDDAARANTAITAAAATLTVGGTGESIGASLASRKYFSIYNNDNRRMFIGPSGVTESTGFPIGPRSYVDLRAGESIDIYFVSPKTGHELRYMELS
jgi:hypothetical protein